MVTGLDVTDKLIADLESAFQTLSQKLIGVQDDLQYRAITGTGGFNDPQLTGETKTTVAQAQSLIAGLWIVVNLVGQRLQEVKTKRSTVKTGIFSGGGAAKELEDQLKLHNLKVGIDTADKMPGGLRQVLFTEQPGFTSVELALNVGPEQLKIGAKAIIEVNDCVSALKAQIADTENKLAAVLPVVTKIGGAAELAHSNATTNVASLKLTYEHDPLGVRKGFEQTVGQHVAAINKALDNVQRAKEKAYSDMGDAKVLMQRLEDKQPTPARTPELRDWLAKLATRLDQEDWGSASAGLDDWIKEASAVLSIKVPPPSYQPPAPSHSSQTPQPRPTPQPSHTNPGRYTPPSHTQAPPYVQQVPTSADYPKYVPAEKSNLEKLLDGELATAPAPAPTTVQKPADPELEKLLAAQTPPSSNPSATKAPSSAALDALVNGNGHQTSAPATPATKPAENNAALDALVNGSGASSQKASPSGQTGTTDPKSTAALDALVNGKGAVTTGSTTTPVKKPDDSKGSSSIEDLISGKPTGKPSVTPATTQTSAPASVNTGAASSGADSSKISDLFDEKKKPSPPPPPVKAKDTATPPPAAKSDATAKPALSQAEQEAAQRKALEDMLKG
jgi:hypothetical protein